MKRGELSSLDKIMTYFAETPEIGIMEFSKEDIVRHPLIIKIEEIFEANS
jgi:phosphate starvation-inducible protein PhoH